MLLGPASNSGVIQEGDILSEVDGKSVLRFPPAQVSIHLLGPKDSSVEIVFLRGEEKVTVNLLRQQPPVPVPSRPVYPPQQN
jgi:C-terminal processing protease CtpA/Prc